MHAFIYPYVWLLWNPTEAVSYFKHRRRAAAAERLDHASMHRLQWERLAKLIDYAHERVPYYRRVFNEAGIRPGDIRSEEDFRRIPILTRRDVQDNLEDLVSVDFETDRLVRNETGGSTGTPMPFYVDRVFGGIQAAFTSRSDAWRGYRNGDKLALIWGAPRDNTKRDWFARFRLRTVLRQRRLNSYAMSAEQMEEFARILTRWRPTYMHGYASSLYIFASFVRDRGLDKIRPRAVSTSAEKLWAYQRSLIEDVFRCRVFDLYGSREIPNMAAECEMHRGLHVNSDNVYLELLQGVESVPPGTVGEVVATPLLRYSMPLIRYRNGDLASASAEPCPCGRPFPLLTEIVGRRNDVLVTPTGEYIHTPGGALFGPLFARIPGLIQFQIYQTTQSRVAISLVGRRPISVEELELVRTGVTQQLGKGVVVTVDQVDSIPQTASGKHRYIISEVSEGEIKG